MILQNEETAVKSLDALQATLLITKHLALALPFILALRRVPVRDVRRWTLLQTIAGELASNYDAVVDWYKAMQLLTGRDLSAVPVSDLLVLATETLSPDNPIIGDAWRSAYSIGLISEEDAEQWIIYEGVTDGSSTR